MTCPTPELFPAPTDDMVIPDVKADDGSYSQLLTFNGKLTLGSHLFFHHVPIRQLESARGHQERDISCATLLQLSAATLQQYPSGCYRHRQGRSHASHSFRLEV